MSKLRNISSGRTGRAPYDRNIKLLAPLAVNGFDVYLYDQIGCGSSARLENIEEYSVERHRRDLEEIVKTIGAEKVILIDSHGEPCWHAHTLPKTLIRLKSDLYRTRTSPPLAN
ncbi:MAG: alpha/beta fold hydrolase [Bacteroidales bacterium]|nr:alpha/beta fold hydrolase [Bacteroidales bacterium]